jgi:hypothetical protein
VAFLTTGCRTLLTKTRPFLIVSQGTIALISDPNGGRWFRGNCITQDVLNKTYMHVCSVHVIRHAVSDQSCLDKVHVPSNVPLMVQIIGQKYPSGGPGDKKCGGCPTGTAMPKGSEGFKIWMSIAGITSRPSIVHLLMLDSFLMQYAMPESGKISNSGSLRSSGSDFSKNNRIKSTTRSSKSQISQNQ